MLQMVPNRTTNNEGRRVTNNEDRQFKSRQRTSLVFTFIFSFFILILPAPCISESCIELIIIYLKSGSHHPKHFFLICLNDNPSKMMKNAFYFISKAFLVFEIFKSLS